MSKTDSRINPIWDLTKTPISDESTKYFEYKEIRERNVNVTGLTKYEYFLNDVDSFILPSKGFLDIRVKLTKTDGTSAWGADEFLALQNGVPLFKEATLKINGKVVERCDDVYKKMLVNGLINFGDDYARTGASQENWFLDTQTGEADNKKYFPDLTLVLQNANPGAQTAVDTVKNYKISGLESATYNEGFAKRELRARQSKVMTLRLPLNRLFGYFQEDRISTGVTMSVELTKNDDYAVIHTATPALIVDAGKLADAVKAVADPKAVINYLSCWIPYVKPSLSAEAFVKSALASNVSQNFSYEYQQVYSKNFDNATADLLWTIGSFSEKPLKLTVFFLNTADLSSYTANTGVFQNKGLSRASFRIGGSKYPEYDYEPDFTNSNYSRLYNEYLRVSDRGSFYDGGSQVSYDTFGSIYPMVCADLRESDEHLFTPGLVTDITFKATISAGTAVTAFCVVTSERQMRLDTIERRMLVDVL